MSLSPEQKLEYLYREYARLSNLVAEHLKDAYGDIRLFGAIGALVIVWKPLFDFVSSTNAGFASDLSLLLGFIGIEILFGIVGIFNMMRQVNTWFYASQLKAFESRILQLLEENPSVNVFCTYQNLSQPRYVNGIYRTAFTFWSSYIKLSITVIPFVVLWFVNYLYALIFLTFAVVNGLLVLIVSQRTFRYYPGQDLVSLKFLLTHTIQKGPLD